MDYKQLYLEAFNQFLDLQAAFHKAEDALYPHFFERLAWEKNLQAAEEAVEPDFLDTLENIEVELCTLEAEAIPYYVETEGEAVILSLCSKFGRFLREAERDPESMLYALQSLLDFDADFLGE